MKKILTIVLALAMVLSCATFALAEAKPTLTVACNDSNAQGEEGYRYEWLKSAFEASGLADKYELVCQVEPVTDSDFFTKMQLQMGDASTCPDLILYDTFQLQADIAAGYFLPMDDMVNGWDVWTEGKIYDATKAGVTGADGHVYGVPSDTDTRGLWYSKEVFAAAGLDTEWQPTSWQDILDTCKALKDAGIEVPMWMSSSAVEAEGTTMNSFLMFFYGTGERLVDDATGIWNINSQGMYDSLNFFHTLYSEGLGGAEYEVIDAYANNTMIEHMMAGECGIILGGNWFPSAFLSTGSYPWEGYQDKIGFAKMPQQNGGDITLSGGWALTIPANSSCPEDAFELLKALMDPNGAYVNFIIARGDLSTRVEMTENEAYSSTPFISLATSYLDFTAFRPANENYSTVSSYIYTAVEEVTTGTPVEEALATYNQKVTELVGADFVNDLGCIG